MHRLLLELKTEGYPRDFLIARLRGRRQLWLKVTGGQQRKQADPWPAMQGELYWLYRTMDRKTREEFALCFLYFELRRVLIALRRLAGRNREGLAQLAVLPLLNRELVRQLQGAADVRDAVRLLDASLVNVKTASVHLEPILVEDGQRQMEEALVDTLFNSALHMGSGPALRSYFGQLVDLHNLLSILKTRRWELTEQRPLLPGGTHTPQQWQALLRPGQELKLRLAANRISGSDQFDAESVEHAMLGRILTTLHRRARAEPDPFLIFNYLWALYLHTRNLGLQRWGGDQLAAWEKLG
jgi:hypothetical protein